MAFSILKKHRTGLEELTGLKCAFVLPQPTTYIKKKLIEAGIPFIQPGREVYLPFLGVALMAERDLGMDWSLERLLGSHTSNPSSASYLSLVAKRRGRAGLRFHAPLAGYPLLPGCLSFQHPGFPS